MRNHFEVVREPSDPNPTTDGDDPRGPMRARPAHRTSLAIFEKTRVVHSRKGRRISEKVLTEAVSASLPLSGLKRGANRNDETSSLEVSNSAPRRTHLPNPEDSDMFTRDDFLASAAHETKVIKHLFTKIDDTRLDYCPGENMRDTRALLHYLTYCGWIPAFACAEGAWEQVRELVEKEMGSQLTDVARFPDLMDEQMRRIRDVVCDLDDEALHNRVARFPWGGEAALGRALVDTSLKFLTAYRMQLFIHAKAGGATELSTMNCWIGRDPEAN